MSLAGSCFSTESAHGPFHHGIRRRGGTIFRAALPSAGPSGHANSPHPSSREGHQSTAWWSSSFLLSDWDPEWPHAAAASLVHLNSVPSVQMRCIITAKRRASATIAFFIPRCLAIFIAQALSQDHFAERNSMTWAASQSIVRIISSPQRETAPGRSRSPDWSLAGVNPNTAPTDFDFRKRAGTSTVAR
jgi:hypothetical protein